MAVPVEVTQALSAMRADVLTVGGAVLVAVFALEAVRFIRRAFDGGGGCDCREDAGVGLGAYGGQDNVSEMKGGTRPVSRLDSRYDDTPF